MARFIISLTQRVTRLRGSKKMRGVVYSASLLLSTNIPASIQR